MQDYLSDVPMWQDSVDYYKYEYSSEVAFHLATKEKLKDCAITAIFSSVICLILLSFIAIKLKSWK